jgi:hypothetical protein
VPNQRRSFITNPEAGFTMLDVIQIDAKLILVILMDHY